MLLLRCLVDKCVVTFISNANVIVIIIIMYMFADYFILNTF